ncbi:DUF3624 domain-containing protein [Shewanella submarina]|uniref:DUF3624 domain-containing protein n=1 Tax=Shewanella submarina TaxID=2016376 RepID=A0ABV7GAL1_9GAMM|nr:DUF3624 domain-containing protein [Shewanella submarina]MCL1038555.1 DUF3624 domain-containing protein [Shewanella submarina]
MPCNSCNDNIFKRKLGRCRACMLQLTLLSIIGWPLWLYLYADSPTQVNAIALGLFCCAFSGLLMVHLMVKAGRLLKARQLRNLRRRPRPHSLQNNL